MAIVYQNVTGSTGVDVELLAPGSSARIKSIMVTNIHATADATVSLFIQDSPTAAAAQTFYIIHKVAIPAKASLLLDDKELLGIDGNTFGLYTTVGSSDTIDVLIN